MNKLRFGIPKGSLQNATINLLEKSGWKINADNGRSYFPDINDDDIEITICRAQEMSRYVENGTIDAGLTGKDWIEENESDVVVVPYRRRRSSSLTRPAGRTPMDCHSLWR